MASKPGSIVHVELHSADPAKSKQFYGEVFGWKFEEMPEMNYTLWRGGEETRGGGQKTKEGGPPPGLEYHPPERGGKHHRTTPGAGGGAGPPPMRVTPPA